MAFDIVLKGGHVIDPKNGIDAVLDVALSDGKVAAVAADLPTEDVGRYIDVSGLYVALVWSTYTCTPTLRPVIVMLGLAITAYCPTAFPFAPV